MKLFTPLFGSPEDCHYDPDVRLGINWRYHWSDQIDHGHPLKTVEDRLLQHTGYDLSSILNTYLLRVASALFSL
jgi:hypothetical protein